MALPLTWATWVTMGARPSTSCCATWRLSLAGASRTRDLRIAKQGAGSAVCRSEAKKGERGGLARAWFDVLQGGGGKESS